MKDNLDRLTDLRRERKGAIKKPTKRGTMTYKKAKKLAWDSFSLWVRKSAIESDGLVSCVTCQIRKEYQKMQAGHFNPGRHTSILFDERGVHPQCFFCNVMKKGMPREYNAYMVKRYGQAVIDDLDHRARNEIKKYTVPELLELAAHYKKLTLAL